MRKQLISDLTAIGCPTDFSLDIRGYSKNHFALYDPNKVKVILYPYKDRMRSMTYPYEIIFKNMVHEVCHHIEWSDPHFIRYKGVMHSPTFQRLFDKYWGRAKALLFFKEVKFEIPYKMSENGNRCCSTSAVII